MSVVPEIWAWRARQSMQRNLDPLSVSSSSPHRQWNTVVGTQRLTNTHTHTHYEWYGQFWKDTYVAQISTLLKAVLYLTYFPPRVTRHLSLCCFHDCWTAAAVLCMCMLCLMRWLLSGLYGSMLVGGTFRIWSQRVCMPTNMITWQDMQISSSKEQWSSLDLCRVVCVCIYVSFLQLIMFWLPAWRKYLLDMRHILNALSTSATVNYGFILTFISIFFFYVFKWRFSGIEVKQKWLIEIITIGLVSTVSSS